jgi:hypothetical protein
MFFTEAVTESNFPRSNGWPEQKVGSLVGDRLRGYDEIWNCERSATMTPGACAQERQRIARPARQCNGSDPGNPVFKLRLGVGTHRRVRIDTDQRVDLGGIL